ncbi:MAG TPA: transglutaminase domain-containing protein [Armatimonadota bacterium]|nr:transglutaminase domain-containing protein [Armatimonadota bacterium]
MAVSSILRETPITIKDAAIPYTITGLNMLAAVFFARDALSPRAFLVSLALIIIGIPASIFFRQRRYNRIVLNLIIMVPLLGLTWALVRNLPGLRLDWSEPIESLMTVEGADFLISLLHIVAITAAGRAFLLVTPRDLLQTPIPSVSIFLLATIVPLPTRPSGRDPLSLFCLLLLLATSLYLFALSHNQLWFNSHIPIRLQRYLLFCTAVCSLALFPIIVLGGIAIQPFNMFRIAQSHMNHRYPHFRIPQFLGNRYGIAVENSIETGGALWPSGNTVIMYVQTNRPLDLLWRSTYYTSYHKGLWTKIGNPGHRTISTAPTPMAPTIFNPSTEPSDPGIIEALKEHKIKLDDQSTDIVKQHFDIRAQGMGIEVPIYGAYQVYRFQPKRQGFLKLNGNVESGISTLAYEYGDSTVSPYEIQSIIKPSPTILKLNKQVSLQDRDAFLQMPDRQYAQMIRKKALEILTQSHLTPQSDPYRIVQQFELYLGSHYRYTLRPAPPTKYDDPIIDFLYYQKKGYCNYFSGAMVMLCRSVGIPARFVVGFATGDEVSTTQQRDQWTTYKVTANHAHSWVEVFLPYYGWYTSDPTSGSTETPSVFGKTWSLMLDMASIIKQSIAKSIHTLKQHPQFRLDICLGLAFLLLIITGVIYLRHERPPVMPSHELSSEEAQSIVIDSYHRMHRWLKLWGLSKPDALTAKEFDDVLFSINPVMATTVRDISQIYIEAQYSAQPVTDENARQTILLLQQLWQQAKVEKNNIQQHETVD